MKRIITIICALALIACFASCTAAYNYPVAQPTEAPADTGEPEATAAPAVTDEPAYTETPVIPDAYVMRTKLTPNEPLVCDIDFDGLDDTILFEQHHKNEWDDEGLLTVTRGAEGADPYTYSIGYCYEAEVYVLDCDISDGRLDILLWYGQDSEDYTSLVARVNEDGTGMFTQEAWYRFDISDPLTVPNEFTVISQCDVLGTRFLSAYATVDAGGLKFSSPFSYEESNGWYGKMTLLKDLTVTIVNSDGTLGEEVTVPAGSELMPVCTDMSSYADLRLPDGRTGRVSVMIGTGDNWGIYLNGIKQDEYFDIMYAD